MQTGRQASKRPKYSAEVLPHRSKIEDFPAMKVFRHLPVPLQIALANLVLAAATFATGIILARALGPHGRGVYGALFLWALTTANIFAWGTQMTLAREAAQRPERARAVYRAAYRLSIIGGLAGAVAFLAVVVPLTLGDRDYPLWIVAIASLIIPFSILNAFQIQIELGRSRFGSYNTVRSLFVAGNALTVATLWLIGVRDAGTFLAVLAAMALGASLSAAWSIRPSLRALPAGQEVPLGSTLRSSTPIALTMLIAGIAQQSDKLFASALFEPQTIGLYLVAATLAQVQGMAGEALAQMFFARGAALANLDAVNRAWLSRRLRQTILLYAGLCAAGLLVLPPLVPLIYGKAYAGAASLLYVLLPALALQGMNRPFEEFLRGLNRAAVLARMAIVLIVIVAGFALAARYAGSIGWLPWGVVCGFAVSVTIAASTLARELGLPVVKLLMPIPADAADLWRTMRAVVFARPAA